MRICPRCKGTGKLNPSKYAKGRKFEWKVRDVLRDHGYKVYRSYGSKGALDLIGVKKTVIGIQCKNSKKAYLPPSDRQKLASVFQNREYTMSFWDMSTSKIQSKTFKIDKILHCYGQMEFRELVAEDTWQTYKL